MFIYKLRIMLIVNKLHPPVVWSKLAIFFEIVFEVLFLSPKKSRGGVSKIDDYKLKYKKMDDKKMKSRLTVAKKTVEEIKHNAHKESQNRNLKRTL